jgi:hypothetical protein
MAVVSWARRPAGLAVVVLLAAVLAAVGVPVPLHGDGAGSMAPASRGAGAAVDGSLVEVVAPVRAVGRLAAEPSLLGVHGHGEPMLFGTVPSGVPLVALMRLGGHQLRVMPAARAAHRLTVGDRAPPFRLSDL